MNTIKENLKIIGIVILIFVAAAFVVFKAKFKAGHFDDTYEKISLSIGYEINGIKPGEYMWRDNAGTFKYLVSHNHINNLQEIKDKITNNACFLIINNNGSIKSLNIMLLESATSNLLYTRLLTAKKCT